MTHDHHDQQPGMIRFGNRTAAVTGSNFLDVRQLPFGGPTSPISVAGTLTLNGGGTDFFNFGDLTGGKNLNINFGAAQPGVIPRVAT